MLPLQQVEGEEYALGIPSASRDDNQVAIVIVLRELEYDVMRFAYYALQLIQNGS